MTIFWEFTLTLLLGIFSLSSLTIPYESVYAIFPQNIYRKITKRILIFGQEWMTVL